MMSVQDLFAVENEEPQTVAGLVPRKKPVGIGAPERSVPGKISRCFIGIAAVKTPRIMKTVLFRPGDDMKITLEFQNVHIWGKKFLHTGIEKPGAASEEHFPVRKERRQVAVCFFV